MDELLPAACASAFCLGTWGAIAALAAFLAHRRMAAVERELGRRALPADEWPYAWYAGASIVWLAALVLAIVGLARKDWARAGRNCALVFLGHMTLATLAATAMVVVDASSGARGSPLPLVIMACAMVAAGAIAAAISTWLFAGARAARIEALPVAEGAKAPGLERWAIYLVSAIAWPVGLAAALVYGKPESVRVGANALRISVAQLLSIALLVCAAIVVLVALAPLD